MQQQIYHKYTGSPHFDNSPTEQFFHGVWQKTNPNYDPHNGQFTSGLTGSAATGQRTIPGTRDNPNIRRSPYNLANGTQATFEQIAAEHAASTTIRTGLLGPGVTPAARDQLTRFVNGTPNPDR